MTRFSTAQASGTVTTLGAHVPAERFPGVPPGAATEIRIDEDAYQRLVSAINELGSRAGRVAHGAAAPRARLQLPLRRGCHHHPGT